MNALESLKRIPWGVNLDDESVFVVVAPAFPIHLMFGHHPEGLVIGVALGYALLIAWRAAQARKREQGGPGRRA